MRGDSRVHRCPPAAGRGPTGRDSRLQSHDIHHKVPSRPPRRPSWPPSQHPAAGHARPPTSPGCPEVRPRAPRTRARPPCVAAVPLQTPQGRPTYPTRLPACVSGGAAGLPAAGAPRARSWGRERRARHHLGEATFPGSWRLASGFQSTRSRRKRRHTSLRLIRDRLDGAAAPPGPARRGWRLPVDAPVAADRSKPPKHDWRAASSRPSQHAAHAG